MGTTPNTGPKVVVIGGGTGSFVILSALKQVTSNITALVNMVDDGGSTGVLRDELGALPPGDVRQCLVALSEDPVVRQLFNYRFAEGAGLKGHSFGNLFLTAMEKMTGSFAEAVAKAGDVLKIVGEVQPITLTDVMLMTEFSDGHTLKGQYAISQEPVGIKKGQKFWLEPNAVANPQALAAIHAADIIVVSPGNLYGSLTPALMVKGVGEALKAAKAVKVYVANLVTKPGQTSGYTAVDYADEIERLAGKPFLDYVLVNTALPTKELLQKYATVGEVGVAAGSVGKRAYTLVGAPLLSGEVWQQASGGADKIANKRTLIRHDGAATVAAILKLTK